MITRILIVFAAMSLTACAGLGPTDSYYQAQSARVAASAQAVKLPLLRITGPYRCDGDNCAIEVYDPRAHERIAGIETGTTGADVAITAINGMTGVLKYGIGGMVIGRALREMGDKSYQIKSGGDVDFRQDIRTTDISSEDVGGDVTGDSFGDQANNAGQVGDDSTHAPTVVNQPDPVVVTPPDPVVVTSPDPVIVTQPDPVVVQP